MASKDAQVEILLSTYNGGLYLRELLDSVLAQTHADLRLLVRDDGSSDDTVTVIKEYAKKNPGRIRLLESGQKRLGPCQSFARLLASSSAGYLMFCDQDDIWLPGKVELTLKAMKELEARYKGMPALVHTDMKVVDEKLKVISESFWRYQNLDPGLDRLNNLLIMNNATGCAMMINGRLKEIALPVPEKAILHDWWIALTAAAFGKASYMDTPTLLYRQHGKNDTGAVRYSLGYFVSRIGRLDDSTALIKRTAGQAEAFFDMNRERFTDAQRRLVYEFCALFGKGRAKRLYSLLKYGFKGSGFLRNLGILVIWTAAKGTGKEA